MNRVPAVFIALCAVLFTGLSCEQQTWETKHLSTMPTSGKVGAFEGAGYEQKGLYRPEADCIMFTRDEVGFCRVCKRAIAASRRWNG